MQEVLSHVCAFNTDDAHMGTTKTHLPILPLHFQYQGNICCHGNSHVNSLWCRVIQLVLIGPPEALLDSLVLP